MQSVFAQARDRRIQPLTLERMLGRIEPQQDDAWDLAAATKDEIAEILIFGQQQTALLLGMLHHVDVGCRRRDLGHVDDVVAGAAKVRDETGVDALIGKPAHG
jgi:hypothetical protein